jgi:hypothetical protein
MDGNIALGYGSQRQHHGRGHAEAGRKAHDIDGRTVEVGISVWIEQGHPQAGQSGRQTQGRGQAAGIAVPQRPPAAQAGEELEGAQHREEHRTDDMERHGLRGGEKSARFLP